MDGKLLTTIFLGIAFTFGNQVFGRDILSESRRRQASDGGRRLGALMPAPAERALSGVIEDLPGLCSRPFPGELVALRQSGSPQLAAPL